MSDRCTISSQEVGREVYLLIHLFVSSNLRVKNGRIVDLRLRLASKTILSQYVDNWAVIIPSDSLHEMMVLNTNAIFFCKLIDLLV